MTLTMWVLVILAIVLIVSLVVCYIKDKDLRHYKEIYRGMSCINVIEKMFDVMGSNNSAAGKIKELNEVLLKTYKPKYSSIVIYDGYTYQVRATNVEHEYTDSIRVVGSEKEFKSNKTSAISKYITTTSTTKTLLYRSALERKIKSALFSPIYYKDMYLGFWLLEDTEENAFENITKEELAKLRKNIGIFLENVQFQNTIEIAENTDKQTGYYNNMYLYSNSRQTLTENDTCALSMICLKNLPEINEDYGRKIGNTLLIKAANVIKDTYSNDSSFIRYSGLRLLVITPNSNAEVVQPIAERVINRMKDEFEYSGDTKVLIAPQVLLHTFKKQNNIEKEIQKMVSYIDGMKDINTIKII